jgi:hypothetical protein
MDAKSVVLRQQMRNRVLEEIYDQTGGAAMRCASIDEVANKLGIGDEDWRDVHDYLLRSHFLDLRGPRLVSMTNGGARYVENLVLKRQEQRYKLLRAFYEKVESRTDAFISQQQMAECAARVRVPHADADLAWQWLKDEGLLEQKTVINWSITHDGVREVEQSVSAPQEATDHFPADVSNAYHVYNISGPVGAIQSGSGNTATFVQNVAVGNDALNAMAQLRAAAEKLSGTDREEALELVDTIEHQAKVPKPKKALIRQCGEGLATKLKEIDVAALMGLIMRGIEIAQSAGLG